MQDKVFSGVFTQYGHRVSRVRVSMVSNVVNSHSYLGVTVSSDLRWRVNNVSAKASKTQLHTSQRVLLSL